MTYRYGILGAGRQGLAAAYDMARFGDASEVRLGDVDADVAAGGAARLNSLLGTDVVTPVTVDVANTAACRGFMRDLTVCLSAVPYRFNLGLTHVALDTGASLCDLGGNTAVVESQLELNEQAQAARIGIVPDCGVGPGMIANLAVHAIEQLDVADDVLIYDGGLPQHPRPPFNFVLLFNVAGLTNEYDGEALYIRDGLIVPVPAFAEDEYELITIPQLGQMEAFTTSGALSTMAHTYAAKLRTLKNKTLRYPGHYAWFKGMRDIGLLNTTPVRVGEHAIAPRDLLHTLLEETLMPMPDDTDLMVIHIRATGTKRHIPTTVTVDMLDRFDPTTGFAAMERTTGFHLAIVAGMIARGEIAPGATPLEVAVPARRMVEELGRRDIQVDVAVSDGS